jgi:hypothetical protein
MGSTGILATGESGPREELPGIDVDMAASFMGPTAGVPEADNRRTGHSSTLSYGVRSPYRTLYE